MSKKLDDLLESFRLDSLKYETSGCETVTEGQMCETTSALYALFSEIVAELKKK